VNGPVRLPRRCTIACTGETGRPGITFTGDALWYMIRSVC
jgi:hypothetical protein